MRKGKKGRGKETKKKAALPVKPAQPSPKKKPLEKLRLIHELAERIAVSTPQELHRQKFEEKKDSPFDYTVVIPAYNEAENITPLLEKLRLVTSNIVLVDDGSMDRTGKIGKRFGLKVVRHYRNMGKGAAIKSGIAAANTENIVLIDGDNQHSPYEIKYFVEKLRQADLVLGDRFSKGAAMPLHRRLANSLIQAVVGARAPKISDPLCGFRAFKKSKLAPKEDGFRTDLEMVFDAVDNGLKIETVPVSVSYGINPKAGGKTFGFLNGVKEYASLVSYAARWAAGWR